MLALAGAAAGGWRAMHPSDSGQMRFPARLSTLPTVLSAEQLQMLRQQSPSAETGIKQTQQQLAQLLQLKPDWALSYGTHLAQQALTLWPEQAKPLAQQWQQQGQRRRASRGESQRLAPGNDAATAVDEPA